MSLEYRAINKELIKLYLGKDAGHIGGSISVIPLIYEILSYKMNLTTDYFVLSKGHNAAALYCVLAHLGIISHETLNTFYDENGTHLGGHVPSKLVSFIPFATGSLGHGLSLAVGMAMAQKLSSKRGHIYCICGDGEWQEGSCWEALNFAVAHRLGNLCIVIDNNNWQGFGQLPAVMGMTTERLKDMLSAFGAHVTICDGTTQESIRHAIDCADSALAAPCVIIAKTIKGMGMLEYEDTLDSHYIPMTKELFDRMMKDADYAN